MKEEPVTAAVEVVVQEEVLEKGESVAERGVLEEGENVVGVVLEVVVEILEEGRAWRRVECWRKGRTWWWRSWKRRKAWRRVEC